MVASLTIGNAPPLAPNTYDSTTHPGIITGTGKIQVSGAAAPAYDTWAGGFGLNPLTDGAPGFEYRTFSLDGSNGLPSKGFLRVNVTPFYQENGPTGFCRYRMPRSQSDFGIEGYFVMLVGNRVPYRKKHDSSAQELARWEAHRAAHVANAKRGVDVKEALYYVRHPGWQWNAEAPR